MQWRMVCGEGAGYGEDGRASGICNGDSGGPLLIETADGLEVAGVSSWTEGCGTQRFPSVFARVDGPRRGWVEMCADDELACAITPH